MKLNTQKQDYLDPFSLSDRLSQRLDKSLSHDTSLGSIVFIFHIFYDSIIGPTAFKCELPRYWH